MKEFLSHIVDDISSEKLASLGKSAYVFPSRRACYYFKEALISKFPDQTFWLPKILSIEEFITYCTGKSISSEIDLLFALYQAYSNTYLPPPKGEVDKEELPTFDKFYSWGQVLLKDFDEVDRYLVDASELYRNLEQLREIETRYQDNEEVLFALNRFNEMVGNDPTALTISFSNQWIRVSKTFHAFKKLIHESHLNYSGMLYREIAESLRSGSLKLPFEKVVFAGFNALSKAEEVIFTTLLEQGLATIYWDADRLYMQQEVEEAGLFMRKNYKKWPPSSQVHWVITDMLKTPKAIKIVGGVQAVGQAQAVGQLLEKLPPAQQHTCGVVLADEGLLFPLLYALPENIESLNVTMGYPAKHSHWFRLSNAYMEYQLHQRGKGEKVFAETSMLVDLLSNPLIQRTVPVASQLLKSLNQKSRWTLISELLDGKQSEILNRALAPKSRVGELAGSLVNILILIYQKLRLDDNLDHLECEFAYHSIRHLMQLEERISKHHQQLEPRTLARLVVQAFEQTRIPFTGEPTSGLQLMGFLETRALDFERIIIVSANEGKLPRSNRHTTYIPYAMRKAFKLPTFEEQDAIYAYHFKRVIQRAKEVTLVYNTEVAIDGSGERSRFIWQLLKSFPSTSISEYVLQMPLIPTSVTKDLQIEKSPQVMEKLQQFLAGNEGQKSLSPTAVRHYLDCSLRFYFRYVVKLREREKESTDLDPRDFGNIVHQALEKLYQPLVGKTLNGEQIQLMLDSDQIQEVVHRTIADHFHSFQKTVLEGKDLLHQQIIEKLLYRVVENDRSCVPFQLIGAEIKASTDLEFEPGKTIRLEGTLDRVHNAEEVVHIVDYKTGKADLIRKGYFRSDIQGYVKTHFEEPRYKSGFQGFFYGLIWNKTHDSPVKLGVYPLKKVNEGIQWLYNSATIPTEGFQIFEQLLIITLRELFDESVPFSQTEDPERCRWCAYKEICQR